VSGVVDGVVKSAAGVVGTALDGTMGVVGGALDVVQEGAGAGLAGCALSPWRLGIYIGNGEFVHAPRTGASGRVDRPDRAYWKRRFNGARRVINDTQSP